MVPGTDGLEVCRTIRADDTSHHHADRRADPIDVVLGLESGADDYVTKPFETRVLVSRAKAVLRRHDRRPEDQTLRYGDLVVDPQAMGVTKGALLPPGEAGHVPAGDRRTGSPTAGWSPWRTTVEDSPHVVVGGRVLPDGPSSFFFFPLEDDLAVLPGAQRHGGGGRGGGPVVSRGRRGGGEWRAPPRPAHPGRRPGPGGGRVRHPPAREGQRRAGRPGPRLQRMAETLESTIAELRDLEAGHRRFVADVSHELRTPLTALTTGGDMLGAHGGGPTDAGSAPLRPSSTTTESVGEPAGGEAPTTTQSPPATARQGQGRSGTTTPTTGQAMPFVADTSPDTSSTTKGSPVLLSVTKGDHPGYVRFVSEFDDNPPDGQRADDARPAWDVRYVPRSQVVQDGSGFPTAVEGAAVLRITFQHAWMHWDDEHLAPAPAGRLPAAADRR